MYISMNEQVQKRKFESFLQYIRLSVNDIQYLHWEKAKYKQWVKKLRGRKSERQENFYCVMNCLFCAFFHILSILLAYAAMLVLLWKIKHVKNKRQFSHYKHWAVARKKKNILCLHFPFILDSPQPPFLPSALFACNHKLLLENPTFLVKILSEFSFGLDEFFSCYKIVVFFLVNFACEALLE